MHKDVNTKKTDAAFPQVNAECAYCSEGLVVRGLGIFPFLTRRDKPKVVFCNQTHLQDWLAGHCEHCDASSYDTALPVEVPIGGRKLQFCSAEHYAAYVDNLPKGMTVVK